MFGPALDWLDGERTPANPYRVTDSFVYGPFNLAVARGVSGWLHDGAIDGDQPASLVVHALDGVGIPLLDDDGSPGSTTPTRSTSSAGCSASLAETAAIVVVALAGRRLAGRVAGLAAAVVMATVVLTIQNAHFLGAEPLVSLASALALWAMVALDRSDDRRRALVGGLAAGAAGGAALAMKVSALAIPALVLGALAALAIRHRRRADLVRVAAAVVGAFVAVRVLYPSAFEGLGIRPAAHVLDDYRRQREAAAADLPPAIQWADRVPLLAAAGLADDVHDRSRRGRRRAGRRGGAGAPASRPRVVGRARADRLRRRPVRVRRGDQRAERPLLRLDGPRGRRARRRGDRQPGRAGPAPGGAGRR